MAEIRLNWNGVIHNIILSENHNLHELKNLIKEIFHLNDNFIVLVETPKVDKLVIDSDQLLQMYLSFCPSPELLIQYEGDLSKPKVELEKIASDPVEVVSTPNQAVFESLNVRPDVIRSVQQYYLFENLDPTQQNFLSAILSERNCVLQDISEMSALISYQIGILQAYKPSSEEMNLEVLVLSSTRELARNRAHVLENMGKDMDMKIPIVIGGENLRETIERVKVKDYSTIFATPDRFLDIFHRGALSLDSLKILILDGLDELIDRGFLDSTTEILSLLPDALDENDGCLFSTQIIAKISTMTTEVQEFINSYFPSAVHLVAPTNPLRS